MDFGVYLNALKDDFKKSKDYSDKNTWYKFSIFLAKKMFGYKKKLIEYRDELSKD